LNANATAKRINDKRAAESENNKNGGQREGIKSSLVARDKLKTANVNKK